MKYINLFNIISELKCNISKTKLILIRFFDREHKLYPDINLKWGDDFTLLGLFIDNKMEKIETNLDHTDQNVINLINK